MCKRGTTSKIQEFQDIYSIKTLGFRGEALSSLCAMGNVTIQTKQPNEETGFHLVYDKQGTLLTQEKVMKNVGTVVSVKDLFQTLPVRLGEFKKSHRT